MNLNYLKNKHKDSLLELLQKYEIIFDGTLSKHTGSDYTIEFQENVKPFPIPTIHEPTIKKEVNRLIKIGVLKKFNNFQWAAPTFIIPKKNGTVRIISDFRQLINTIKQNLFQFNIN